MTIRYSNHLRQRAPERGFTLADVDHVVEEWQMGWEDSENQSMVLTGTTEEGRQLTVCLVHPPEEDGSVFVKTAYFV